MYIDAKSFENQPLFQQARLISPIQQKSAGSCIHFYYHALGKDIGTLNIYSKIFSNGDLTGDLGLPIFSVSGNRGDE